MIPCGRASLVRRAAARRAVDTRRDRRLGRQGQLKASKCAPLWHSASIRLVEISAARNLQPWRTFGVSWRLVAPCCLH